MGKHLSVLYQGCKRALINWRKPLHSSWNPKKYEIQCHASHASVPAPRRKHQKYPVFSTPPPSAGRSGKTHGRGIYWRGCSWCVISTVLWDRKFQITMCSLWHTWNYPTRRSMPHRGWFRSLRKDQKKYFWACGATAIIGSLIHSRVWISSTGGRSRPAQRQGVWRDSPVYPSLWHSKCRCHQRWNLYTPLWGDFGWRW